MKLFPLFSLVFIINKREENSEILCRSLLIEPSGGAHNTV